MYSSLTIEELQCLGVKDDTAALIELGRRVIDIPVHDHTGNMYFCEAEWELKELEISLNNEIPPECPNCGHFLTDK